MEKIDIEKYKVYDISFGEHTGEGKVLIPLQVITEKINEIIDSINKYSDICEHDFK